MPDMPGDTFVSKGIKYELQPGPEGNLRPYTVGPEPTSGSGGWPTLIVGAIALLAGAVVAMLSDDDS